MERLLRLGATARKTPKKSREKWTKETDNWGNFGDPSITAARHWNWALTPFIESLTAGFGWELVHKESWRGWIVKNRAWRRGGFVFTRKYGRRDPSNPLA